MSRQFTQEDEREYKIFQQYKADKKEREEQALYQQYLREREQQALYEQYLREREQKRLEQVAQDIASNREYQEYLKSKQRPAPIIIPESPSPITSPVSRRSSSLSSSSSVQIISPPSEAPYCVGNVCFRSKQDAQRASMSPQAEFVAPEPDYERKYEEPSNLSNVSNISNLSTLTNTSNLSNPSNQSNPSRRSKSIPPVFEPRVTRQQSRLQQIQEEAEEQKSRSATKTSTRHVPATRKSPFEPAKEFPGQIRVGLDGHNWKSQPNKHGIYRWVAVRE